MQRTFDSSFWMLNPAVTFLNHGSFGSCPRAVFAFQQRLREQMEADPISFFVRDLERLLDGARSDLAHFVSAARENIVFVTNATTGVNAALRSFQLRPKDEVLVTDHEYNACRNALNKKAQESGCSIRVIQIPFPIKDPGQIIDVLKAGVSRKTRLALIDHVTSPTGLVFPLDEIIPELTRRGVETLVDGAHAPGMLPLNLTRLAPAFYTGNCHKWICAPKGAAFLYVRPDLQAQVRPVVISHGANSPRTERSRFLIEFDWTGTWDPTAYLTIPEALRVMGSLLPGGWSELMRRNRELALSARQMICDTLKIPMPCPETMIGALASFPIPDAKSTQPPTTPLYLDPFQELLREKYKIEVPIIPWPGPPKRLLRISCQAYNEIEDYEALCEALKEL